MEKRVTTFLFDTQVLIWASIRPERLTRVAAALISDESNALLVSAASAWEVATKVRIGKLKDAEELESDFLKYMEDAGYTLLPVSVEDALRAGRLPGDHGDPFDRIIAAQALTLDIAVISNDRELDAFGVRRIW